MASLCRQNYHEECEAAINKQINMELYTSNVYLTMAAYFGRDDVALKGFQKFFSDCAHEEHEHAEKLIKYQNLRGGRVVMQAVERPSKSEWETPLAATQYAMELQKNLNESLLDLHKLATVHADPHLTHYLEDEFLEEQAEALYKLSKHITNLHRVGDGLGVYIFDKDLQ